MLKTLGDINQVSTESQVQRIVWITVTGNLFFFARAFLETLFAVLLVAYLGRHDQAVAAFSHRSWDAYLLLEHGSELAILGLMLFILQRNFAAGGFVVDNKQGCQAVPEAGPGDGSAAAEACDPAPSTLLV